MIKFKRVVVCLSLAVVVFDANAAIVDNGTYTTDTNSGLDWLDLTMTTNMSYNDISAQLGAGGVFAGWRYATEVDIIGFLDAFGGDSNYYDGGWSAQNNGLFDAIAPLWGDTYCEVSFCPTGAGDGASYFYYDGALSSQFGTTIGGIADLYTASSSASQDEIDITATSTSKNTAVDQFGSALIRDAFIVPVPASIWLMCSGLLGLVGLARKK